MTDLEGVAGVNTVDDWLSPAGLYYETGRRLLTLEVNAAVRAFSETGFQDIMVADGHGYGAINIELLDPRARLMRGWAHPPYPLGLDRLFDAVAYGGQHAKAGTAFSHLTHTGWWDVRDQRVNGVSIGEYGEGAFCAGELGVPHIFASGEKAFCKEVAALTPWVITAEVLEGVIGGTGDDLSGEEYEHFHQGAIHLHPEKSRELIHARASDAAQAFRADRGRFQPLKLKPPHRLEHTLRPYKGKPASTQTFEHPESVIALFNRRCTAAPSDLAKG